MTVSVFFGFWFGVCVGILIGLAASSSPHPARSLERATRGSIYTKIVPSHAIKRGHYLGFANGVLLISYSLIDEAKRLYPEAEVTVIIL